MKSPANKSGLHPRNKHLGRYDFDVLIQACPSLSIFVRLNEYGDASIDFSNAQAVKLLNKALLKQFYALDSWDIPAQYLCPPIPGRADYLHYAADLLYATNVDKLAVGERIRVLDIGVGANVIYPIIGHHEYGWQFVGADIDPTALKNAQKVVNENALTQAISLRLQADNSLIFKGIIKADEAFHLTICNPPFHASLNEAIKGTQRKWRGLGKHANNRAPKLNFGGQANELYCEGGEETFVISMINESKHFASQCLWFTTLISKAAHLPSVYRALKKVDALQVKTIEMSHGQKQTRFVAWTFLNRNQQADWFAD